MKQMYILINKGWTPIKKISVISQELFKQFDTINEKLLELFNLSLGLSTTQILVLFDLFSVFSIIQLCLFLKKIYSSQLDSNTTALTSLGLAGAPQPLVEEPVDLSTSTTGKGLRPLAKPHMTKEEESKKRKLDSELTNKLNKKQKKPKKYILDLFVILDTREPDKKLVVPRRSYDNYWLQGLIANNPVYEWERTTFINPVTLRRESRWGATTYSGDTFPPESTHQCVANIPDTDRVEIISNNIPVQRHPERGEMTLHSMFSADNNVFVRNDGN